MSNKSSIKWSNTCPSLRLPSLCEPGISIDSLLPALHQLLAKLLNIRVERNSLLLGVEGRHPDLKVLTELMP